MRYFFAITSLVISALMLLLGVGQITFLAGPKTIEEKIPLASDSSPYTVIEQEILTLNPGNPAVIVAGESVFVATAHMRDINAWLETFDHDYARLDGQNVLFLDRVRGILPTPEAQGEDDAGESVGDADTGEEEDVQLLDPRGSDLWITENQSETLLKVALSLETNQGVLVTAGDEDMTTPKEITLMWSQPRTAPYAGPLLVLGAFFGVLGIILYLLAVDHDRRGLGPRRGRKGMFQGIRNKTMKLNQPKTRTKPTGGRRGTRLGSIAAASIAGAMLLTSCSPSYWPQPPQVTEEVEQTPSEENLAVVPVTDAQLQKIFDQIAASVKAADNELDVNELQDRFAGPALTQRKANYTVVKQEPGWHELPHITGELLPYGLIQSTEKWPRTIFVTAESTTNLADLDDAEEPVEGEEETEETSEEREEEVQAPTLALVLRQESPHENFSVQNIVQLRGGIEMPEAAPASEGTAVLGDDIKTMLLSPRDAAEALASLMQNGLDEPAEEEPAEDAEDAEYGEEEEPSDPLSSYFSLNEEMLIDKMGLSWANDQCVEGLKCSVQVVVSEDPIVTFSTGQSGVLVLATILDRHIMEAKNTRDIVTLSKVERALGLDGSYKRVVREWQHQVLMYVPGQDSDKKITVLGSSSELVRASGKKAEI